VAARLGVPPERGTVELEDGTLGTWTTVGSSDDELPFFIRYARSHAERAAANADRVGRAAHDCQPRGIAWVEPGGDPQRLREWLGDCPLDVRPVGGKAGLHRFAVRTDVGEIVIE
jgi:hypothetical protein